MTKPDDNCEIELVEGEAAEIEAIRQRAARAWERCIPRLVEIARGDDKQLALAALDQLLTAAVWRANQQPTREDG